MRSVSATLCDGGKMHASDRTTEEMSEVVVLYQQRMYVEGDRNIRPDNAIGEIYSSTEGVPPPVASSQATFFTHTELDLYKAKKRL